MASDMTCQSVMLKFQWALHSLVNDVAMQLLFVNVCPLIWKGYVVKHNYVN